MTQLQAEKLTLQYDGHQVIRQLELSILPRCITTIIGPNGCGKSTLLKALARLLYPSEGAAYLDGKAIHKMNTREVARAISILPQNHDAPDDLLVQELVAFGRFSHRPWFGAEAHEQTEVQAALDIVGIAHLSRRRLGELSGGQRQLAWIAMAVAQSSGTMLLDEPTTFLDIAHQLEVLSVLQTLQRQLERTIVLVLHDVNQAARYSHELIAMQQGSIYRQGTPDEVLTREMFAEVFGVEATILDRDEYGRKSFYPVRPIKSANRVLR